MGGPGEKCQNLKYAPAAISFTPHMHPHTCMHAPVHNHTCTPLYVHTPCMHTHAHPCTQVHASTHTPPHTLAHGHAHTPVPDMQPMAHSCTHMHTGTPPMHTRTHTPHRESISFHQCVTSFQACTDLKFPEAGALGRGRPTSALQCVKGAGPRLCPDSSALGSLWGVGAKTLAQTGQNCVNNSATSGNSLRKALSKSVSRYNLKQLNE